MESPTVPTGANYAMSGGIGYYDERAAATAAFSARVGEMSSVSAGIGVGFDSGEVGARAGFQVAW
jgi:trimeric autotransporter adhesin